MENFTYTEKKDTRSGFGDGLTELGLKNKNIVALCADLTGSLKMNDFKKNEFIFKKFKKNFYKTIETINFKISSFRKKIFFLGCGHNLLVFLRQCNLQSKINKIIDDNKSKINKYPNNIDTKIVSGKYLLKIKDPIIVTSTPPELDNLIKKKLIINSKSYFFFTFFN